jgi:hypothetical protein
MANFFGDVNPVLLLAMIAGWTEFFKRFGLKDKGALAFALGIGIFFGILFQLAEMYGDLLNPWFKIVVYGFVFGLTAAGLYDLGTGKNRQA